MSRSALATLSHLGSFVAGPPCSPRSTTRGELGPGGGCGVGCGDPAGEGDDECQGPKLSECPISTMLGVIPLVVVPLRPKTFTFRVKQNLLLISLAYHIPDTPLPLQRSYGFQSAGLPIYLSTTIAPRQPLTQYYATVLFPAPPCLVRVELMIFPRPVSRRPS